VEQRKKKTTPLGMVSSVSVENTQLQREESKAKKQRVRASENSQTESYFKKINRKFTE
jgi:hypothetical protein